MSSPDVSVLKSLVCPSARTLLVRLYLLAAAFFTLCQSSAQQQKNEIDVDISLLGHGEMRYGGLVTSSETNASAENYARFLLGRARLSADYKRGGLEVKVTAQHQGVWGQKGQGEFNLFEAWAKLKAKNGLFAQFGRQALAYDDERIIGPNDWAMAANSHDVLRLGYEGHGHRTHFIFGFNQNAENISGGTFYSDGAQPYKSMQTFWYHYDVPRFPLGVSVLFMNVSMQGGELNGDGPSEPRNRYQHLVGGFVSYSLPERLSVEASYYHQMGHNEHNMKINAWMTSVKASVQLLRRLTAVAGFDYLSGDKYFAVRGKNMLGVVRHDVQRGFNPVYGSHHKFYGMMDFFYVQTYLDGFTPGLQNLYIGAEYFPLKKLKVNAMYHYMATATKLQDINMTLGHDIDVEASYQILKDVKLSLGFSYMTGTETMQKLKRVPAGNDLKWGWFSLDVSPRIFSKKW